MFHTICRYAALARRLLASGPYCGDNVLDAGRRACGLCVANAADYARLPGPTLDGGVGGCAADG